MKPYLLVISLLFYTNVFGQTLDSTSFYLEDLELTTNSFIVLPIAYTGNCFCRLDSNSSHVMEPLSIFISKHDNIIFQIEGHTNSRGYEQANLKISELRAKNTVNNLVERGVKIEQVKTKAFGELEPWIVSKEDSQEYDFLKEGDTLTDDYITPLTKDQREICHTLNNRTILRIIEIIN